MRERERETLHIKQNVNVHYIFQTFFFFFKLVKDKISFWLFSALKIFLLQVKYLQVILKQQLLSMTMNDWQDCLTSVNLLTNS